MSPPAAAAAATGNAAHGAAPSSSGKKPPLPPPPQQQEQQQELPKQQRNCWSDEEHAKLVALVERYGRNWARVESHLPGRTGKQCRERYQAQTDREKRQGNWTVAEEYRLALLHSRLGTRWVQIAAALPGSRALLQEPLECSDSR
ncbi:hypothetical protein OEZ85_000065 [Tetradesmus obliquus]|uniref:Myb-like domain-containing protein n=1 Tax=Tetradesmus obliquus TaxID=3088 RepID=A0ABY8USI5_TETOB|nr:hypothetical protein OEZ85_000065 [Tetradesmus obliquus]